ncbi:hypothetical protein AJ80_01654 [Polytolypa hystricis UAMH7299]|uniref:Protein CMS1 n=1 Tax=Polytolypa hystricis (strain UAMH7299) TaxID=1447883 RepID=A0A2B7Z0Q0_POLH7|nr:hypothetical protein AJ80_01654 [Polytolypa hystricis UAMH7299]
MATVITHPPPQPAKSSKKRTREEAQDTLDEGTPAVTSSTTPTNTTTKSDEPSKKKKRKRTKQISEDAKDSGKKAGIDESIGKMDGRLLADFFAQQAQSQNSELTTMELDDIYVPEQAFLDTSSWQSSRNLENLPSFLKAHVPKKGASLSIAPEETGSPHTLVITLAGLRAADITRSLRPFQNKDCAVAKLFAKHIKLKEAKEFVQRTRIGIGVGTPARVNDLVDSDALNLGSLKRIVIDGSYIDQKKRGIFDMREIHFPLLRFLNRVDLRERYAPGDDSRVQILVF